MLTFHAQFMATFPRSEVFALLSLFSFLFGLSLGSFINVLIYRLPKGESIIFPPSHCPHCQIPLKFYDNIPLLSFLILKGKCRSCKQKISIRYPIVEALTASLVWLSFYKFGISFQAFISTLFFSSLVLISFIDLDSHLIPNKIVYPLLLISLVLFLFSWIFKLPLVPLMNSSYFSSIYGFLLGGGILYLVALISPFVFKKEGMGGGDIKLASFIGIYLGYYILLALLFAFFFGSIGGLLLIKKGGSTKSEIPFAPFLSLGALFTFMFGFPIARWYFSFL